MLKTNINKIKNYRYINYKKYKLIIIKVTINKKNTTVLY